MSAVTDTFALSVTNAADWDMGGLPMERSLEGLGNEMFRLMLTVTPEVGGGTTNVVTIQATSQDDTGASK
jgi:hypothetical protein